MPRFAAVTMDPPLDPEGESGDIDGVYNLDLPSLTLAIGDIYGSQTDRIPSEPSRPSAGWWSNAGFVTATNWCSTRSRCELAVDTESWASSPGVRRGMQANRRRGPDRSWQSVG